MEYVDLKRFEEFIRERDLVPEAHRTFYLNWVRRFLKAEFSANELSAKDKVECFSDQLARNDSVKDWQLRQALQAVSLYLDVFLKEGNWDHALGNRGADGGLAINGQDARATGLDDGASPSKEEAVAKRAVIWVQTALNMSYAVWVKEVFFAENRPKIGPCRILTPQQFYPWQFVRSIWV